MFPKDPEIERLLRLARSQEIHNEQVAACWPVIIESIDNDWIVPATVKDEWTCSVSIDELISVLSKGSAIGAQEVDFDLDDGSAVITFVGVECRCPLDALIAELQRLKDGYYSDRKSLNDPFHDLAALLGITPEELIGQTPDQVRQGLKDVAAELQSIFQDAQSSGPEGRAEARERLQGLMASLSSKGVLGLEHIEELPARFQAALDSGAWPDPKILAGGLRTIADWLEGRDGSGEAIDELVGKLERSVDGLLGRDPDAEASERLRARVGSSIARALRARGIRPAGDE